MRCPPRRRRDGFAMKKKVLITGASRGIGQGIALELAVPMTVLLPGGPMEVPVRTCLPVAETVIVGRVPDTYLQLEGLPASG